MKTQLSCNLQLWITIGSPSAMSVRISYDSPKCIEGTCLSMRLLRSLYHCTLCIYLREFCHELINSDASHHTWNRTESHCAPCVASRTLIMNYPLLCTSTLLTLQNLKVIVDIKKSWIKVSLHDKFFGLLQDNNIIHK